jgi:signal transduction histidine kinase/CheY-like chemotaxis protein
MRFPTTLLCLTLLATASVCARWDDPEAGLPIIRRAPAREVHDPMLSGVVVDHRGRLYCSGDYLFEFNGDTWTPIPASNGNVVMTVTIDEANRIWCGGINDLGYVDEDATGLRTFHSLRSHLPPASSSFTIWDVYRLAGRTLFVAIDELFIWDGVHFELRKMPVERRLFSFEFEGSVYVSQPGTGLWRWDGTRTSAVDLGGAELEAIQAAWRDSNHRAVFLANNSLVRLEDDRAVVFSGETISQIRPHLISTTTELPDGNIAMLTVSAGIVVVTKDGAFVRKLDRIDGLPSLFNSRIAPARNGYAWITGSQGVSLLDTRQVQSIFSEQNGLDGEGTRVISTPANEVLMANIEGVARLSIQPLKAARFDKLPFLRGSYRDIAVLTDGTVALAGMKEFVSITPTGATPLIQTEKDVLQFVQLSTDPPKLAAIEGSTVVVLDLDRVDPRENTIDGFPDVPTRLTFDARGTGWVGLYHDGVFGVDRITSPEPVKRHFAPGSGLPAPFGDPGLFVLGGDAFAFTPGAVVALPTAPEGKPRVVLPGIGLFAAEQTGADMLWAVASITGREPRLVQITRDSSGELKLRITDQIIRDAGYVISLSRTQEHILWVGGRAGFIRIDSREVGDEPAPQAPIVQAVSWRAGEQVTRLPLAGGPTVDFARTGTIEFQLRDSGDPFAPTQLIETRLAGQDQDWRLTGKSRRIDGLDEGTYTLEARVVSFLGNPGPVVNYTFTITPPWFRTPLAYLAYVLAFGGTVTLAAQWRTRRIRRQNAQLEQLVNRRTEELAQAVSSRSAFLANMGHEIRNPLNGVVGLVDTLRARELAPEQKGIVDRIGTCADQLISVIDDVLEYARIDAGRIALRNRTHAVREPVEGAIDILRAAKPEAVIELQGGPDDLDASVVGDPDRVRHILVNYISNALKFGGGTPVQVAVRRDGALLVFAVTDHGPGIAPEEQARLFVRFSRGSAAYRHGIPGTGLGLAACKAYAEAMGGDVSVESEPGQGATFFLRLPFRPATEGVDESAGAARPDLMVGKRALVVDDQDFNRFVLTDLLGRMGATTEQAASVDEARARFCARTPDIVFVDFDLAGATGADLAAWIRKEAPAGRDVPVVATTAFEVDEVRRRCDEAGMDGFLAKPVTARRLAEVVARIETIRSGGPAPAAPTVHEPPVPSSFLDILAGGDPDKRREIERSTWREVLVEALAAHRALRRGDAALTARHAHRLVSAALILSERELVATARELNAVAKAGDLPSARLCAQRLRRHIRTLRARKVT